MITTGSITRRLTLLLAAVAALLSILSWSMVSASARQAAERTQDNILAASASIIAEALRSEDGEVRLELPYPAFSMLEAVGEDRVFYEVVANGERLTGNSALSQTFGPAPRGQSAFQTSEFDGEALRIAAVTRVILTREGPVPVTVYIGQTQNGVGLIARDLSLSAALLSVAFFVVAVGLSAIVARTSLRQLKVIADAVARRGPSDLRPLTQRPPEELAPLMQSLNTLIARLARSLRQSEDFIAEAAHRIRTPLATVRAQAEVALHSVEKPENKQRIRQIIRAVDESSRSAGQLLDHATVAYRAENIANTRIDLSQIAEAATAALRPTAELKDIDIQLQASEAIVRCDDVLMENALRNILDNAVKYSPPETTVTVTVSSADGEGRITVRDMGPGLGEAPADTYTERFKRGPNAAGTVGSGLGLTIARDALAANAGRLDLGNGERGGTCVSLILPLA